MDRGESVGIPMNAVKWMSLENNKIKLLCPLMADMALKDCREQNTIKKPSEEMRPQLGDGEAEDYPSVVLRVWTR